MHATFYYYYLPHFLKKKSSTSFLTPIHTDPNQECTPYTYSPVASLASSFPANWVQPAVIVANDTEALNKWNSIKSSIPTNIPVKGTVKGDFSNFTPTYNTSDPDCWWTYDKCDTPKLAGLSPDIISIPEPQSLGYGFDDGPNCSHNAFYNFLTSNKQKASKFPLVYWLTEY